MKPSVKIASPGIALTLLFSLFVFFLILMPIFTGLLQNTSIKTAAVIRISMVLQDIFAFILPSLVVALAATRLPARFLRIDSIAPTRTFIFALATLLCAIPAMNAIVYWNENINLPTQFQALEEMMRQLEENAQAVTDTLMQGSSVPSLIVSVLIVGVLAGVSEELFFRGAFQQSLMSTTINRHASVWIVAIVFSLCHFQMFGFVPRMLLGAYFGYLMMWSRSIWVPIMVHVANNTLVVIATWRMANYPNGLNLDQVGTNFNSSTDMALITISIILTAIFMRLAYMSCRK